jgi:hypothetical protein
VPPPFKPPQARNPQAAAQPRPGLGQAKDAIADECTELETELEELKVKYEMYFLGVEKREPVKWREDLKKKVLRIKEAFTRNAGLRFRLQSLHARFLSYERLWLRSAREREEGTYHRDVFKAKMHVEARVRKEMEKLGAQGRDDPFAKAAAQAAVEAAPPPSGKAPAAKAAAAPAKAAPPTAPAAAARPPAPPAAAAGGVADRQMRELYTQYIAAKKQCGEDVSRLTYDAVSKSVQKQVPDIMARYKAKSVEFKVVVKDGKATLKAVPKT